MNIVNTYITSRNKLVKDIFSLAQSNKPKNAYSVFLCGAAGKEASKFRFALGKAIEETQSQSAMFSVYYPETLFSELLYGRAKHNLLSLENVLADNVSAVVLPLQSPGTFAELGAFTNNDRLRAKLIVINQNKFRRVRSFVNDGPIALLDKRNVIYDDMKFDKDSITNLKYQIRDKTKAIQKNQNTKRTLFDMRFVLFVLIYVFDPISREDLIDIIKNANVLKDDEIMLLNSAVSVLGTNGYVHLTSNLEYTIVPKSFASFLRKSGYNNIEVDSFQKKIDSCRVIALNYQLRKK